MLNNLIAKFSLKMAGVASVVGFIFSFLIVLISGGGFPSIILRPLLSAMLFGMLWIFGYMLLSKFVPEIIAEFKKDGADDARSSSGESGFINEDLNNSLDNVNRDNPGDFKFDVDKDEDSGEGNNYSDQDRHDQNEQFEATPFGNKTSDAPVPTKSSNPAKPKMRAGSDEILVQGIPIKKDTELMARAIQHVLDTDKE